MARRNPRHERPIPAHPYRDSALVYGTMAVVLVAVALLTGGSAGRTILAAFLFFAISTTWSCWTFRKRIKARDAAPLGPADGDVGERFVGSANGNGRRGRFE